MSNPYNTKTPCFAIKNNSPYQYGLVKDNVRLRKCIEEKDESFSFITTRKISSFLEKIKQIWGIKVTEMRQATVSVRTASLADRPLYNESRFNNVWYKKLSNKMWNPKVMVDLAGQLGLPVTDVVQTKHRRTRKKKKMWDEAVRKEPNDAEKAKLGGDCLWMIQVIETEDDSKKLKTVLVKESSRKKAKYSVEKRTNKNYKVRNIKRVNVIDSDKTVFDPF